MVGKVYVSMGNNFIKNSRIKILKPYAHLHMIGRKSTKFQKNPVNERCKKSCGDKIMVGKL